MLYHDGALLWAPSRGPRLIEVSRSMPVLVNEEDLSLWRSLKRCLTGEASLMVVHCPSPSADILAQCARFQPCILIIEQTSLEKLDPQCFIQTVDFGRSVYVLVKVGRDDPATLERLLRLGCRGFVTERSSPSVLRQAIWALSRGEIWASRRFLADVIHGLLTSPIPNALTPRESQILELIARGLSNRDITKELFISRETVRWHIRTLYAKIGVKNRAEAAHFTERLTFRGMNR